MKIERKPVIINAPRAPLMEMPLIDVKRCGNIYVPSAPALYISTGFGLGHSDSLRNNFESFRVGGNNAARTYTQIRNQERYYLPHGSIVEVENKFQEHIKNNIEFDKDNSIYSTYERGGDLTYIPVKIKSVSSEFIEDELLKSYTTQLSGTYRTQSKSQRASEGLLGHFPNHSLKRIDQFSFVVTKDSEFLNLPGDLKNKVIQLVKNDKGFKVERCCIKNECEDKYKFKIIESGEEFKVDLNCCNPDFFKSLLPISNRKIAPFLQLLSLDSKEINSDNLVYIESFQEVRKSYGNSRGRVTGSTLKGYISGLVQIPYGEKYYSSVNGNEMCLYDLPFNSVHYPKSKHCETDDLFLEPHAMCSFMKTLKEFEEDCIREVENTLKMPNNRYEKVSKKFSTVTLKSAREYCKVQIGDMFTSDSYAGRIIHNTHDSGRCIDIRPFNTRGETYSLNLASKNGTGQFYDQQLTELFMKKAKKYGASNIMFGDSSLYKSEEAGSDLFTLDSGHKDHIHVCFSHVNFGSSKVDEKEADSVRNCQPIEDGNR